MIPITERLTTQPAARPRTKLRKFRGITIHDTGNPSPTANAEAHANLLVTRNSDPSWHYSVDDHSIFRSIPEDEVAWHAGDGAGGTGNNETIAIESCINVGNDYAKTMNHMIDLCADILFRRGIKICVLHLFQHNHWTGKNCPAYIRANNLWHGFTASVQEALNKLWEVPAQTGERMKIFPIKFIVTDPDPKGLVVRQTPGTGASHPILKTVYKDHTFVANEMATVDGYIWAKGPEGWIPLGPDDLSQVWATALTQEAELATMKAKLDVAVNQASTYAGQLLACKSKLAQINTLSII